MALAKVYSRASIGIRAPLVTVEIHISRGMPRFNIVGLPETAVKESKDRVRSALINTGFEFPTGHITANLAPADLPKEGGRFDLPIALGILCATGQLPRKKLAHFEFTGELALSGELRPVRGILPVAMEVKQSERQLIIPEANALEASLIKQFEILSANHLLEVCGFLTDKNDLPYCSNVNRITVPTEPVPNLNEVRGQAFAKRALEIAAAGQHSLLFVGPPGTGKTMLATRLASILPSLSDDEALEVAALASLSSEGFDPGQWATMPFRAPHHTASGVALVGGGRPPRPGEISLAHGGILFLDELPEFNRHVLDCLREPLESGVITISRAAFQTSFPARFQLIAAMNPCPCGYAGSKNHCRCHREQVNRYLGKLSGPFLDRIDMQIEVPLLPPSFLQEDTSEEECSGKIKQRVCAARQIQLQRQQKTNAKLNTKELSARTKLCQQSKALVAKTMERFNLSTRAFHRISKVARTIADLAGKKDVQLEHVSEALAYRCLDRMKSSI